MMNTNYVELVRKKSFVNKFIFLLRMKFIYAYDANFILLKRK